MERSARRCCATSRKSLKPGGRVGIVEFTKDGSGPGPPMEERVDPERVIRDAEAAGPAARRRAATFLRYQYLLSSSRRRRDDGRPRLLRRLSAPRRTRSSRRLVPDAAIASVQRSMAYTCSRRRSACARSSRCSCAELCGGTIARGAARGRAIELVHASSLILDDLPSMDDAPLRRGRADEPQGVRRSDRDPRGVRAARTCAFGDHRARVRSGDLAARLTSLLSPTRSDRRPDRRPGGGSARHRPADRLRDARADPSRQDRRAVRRRGDRGRADRRRRRRRDRGAAALTRRTSASRSRSSTTCSTSKGIRPRPARRCAEDLRKTTFVSFSGVAGARQLARRAVRHRRSRARAVRPARRPAARAVGSSSPAG